MTRRLLALLLLLPAPLAAQDRPVDEGIRIGISYNPGVRPTLLVLPQAGLDSARAIMARDLDYSDRFEVVSVPAGSSPAGPAVNYRQYRVYGAQHGVDVLRGAAPGSARVRLHDLAQGKVLNEQETVLPDPAAAGFRRFRSPTCSASKVKSSRGTGPWSCSSPPERTSTRFRSTGSTTMRSWW